jgi:hypothetical protein
VVHAPRTVKRLALVLGVVATLVPLTARTALAQCECSPGLATPRGQAAAASVVFTGTVFSITTPNPDGVSVLFHVNQLYKGSANGNITITTPEDRAACHFDFVLSTRYTVFADVKHVTTSCSGNIRGVINPSGYGLAPASSDRAAPPDARAAPAWVWVVIAAALLAVGAAGYVVTRRRAGGEPS